ncbi:MAG TPA: Ig-like domain-containing protein, partial [Acidimicrobiales bacterium]|nr:Ig-like domain-containing protein [Acidimicrobiales bacterium]
MTRERTTTKAGERLPGILGRGLLALAVVAGSALGAATVAGAAGTTPSTTTLTSNHASSKAGQTSPVVTYTAVVKPTTPVTPSTPNPPAPTGTVLFKDGTATVSGCSAKTLSPDTATRQSTATCTPPASSMTAGAHHITAVYQGDGTYATSQTNALTQTVAADTTSTAVTNGGASPAGNPSSPGVAVTYTATITPGTPTALVPSGTVAFTDGGTGIAGCTAKPVSGTSTFTATCTEAGGSLSIGTHQIKAVFTATGSDFSGATSPTFAQTVAKNTPAVAVTAAPTGSSNYGTAVTLTARVTASGGYAQAPTGSVTFKVNGTAVTCSQGAQPRPVTGTGPAIAVCTTRLSAGSSQKVTAAYSGDANFATKTSATLTYTVNKYRVTESLATTSSGGTTTSAGFAVTYTVTVTGATGATAPGGKITFKDGATAVCSGVTLTPASGVTSTATCTEPGSAMSAGSHTITATYTPTANYLAASSTPTVTQVVSANATGMSITAPGTLKAGVAHTWGATVHITPTTPHPSLSPAGTVAFTDKVGGVTKWTCTATLAAGANGTSQTQSTCAEPSADLTAGTHVLSAVYTSSDGNYTGSTATPLTVTVVLQGMSAAVTSTAPAGVPIATAVTYTATFTQVSTGGTASTLSPTGKAAFTDTVTGGTHWTCTATPTASAGQAVYQCTEPATKVTGSTHHISVQYAGNSYFATVAGVFNQTVTPRTTTATRASTMTVGTSNSPGYPGVAITYTATVTGKSIFAPAGAVKFTSSLGWTKTARVQASTPTGCTYTTVGVTTRYSCTETTNSHDYLTAGPQTIVATFSGDPSYRTNTASLTQTVTQDSTSVGVKSTPASVTAGEVVHFTTTVTPSHGHLTPVGKVHYSDAVTGFTCTSGALVPGTVPYTATTPAVTGCTELATAYAVGTYPIVAIYYPSGGNYLSSDNTASPYIQRVGVDPTTVTVHGPSGGPFAAGLPLQFTATLTPTNTSALQFTGTITFSDSSGNRCVVPVTVVASGPQTFSCTFSSPNFVATATDVITASYSGNANFGTSHGSTSGTSPQFKKTTSATPSKKTTQATVTVTSSSLGGSLTTTPVAYTATITGPATGQVTPTGTVTFTDTVTGTVVWTCTATLHAAGAGSATATCVEPATRFKTGTKTHVVTAKYNGNTTFKPVTSGPFHQHVLPAATTIGISAISPSNVTVLSVNTPATLTATITSTHYRTGMPLTPTGAPDSAHDGYVDFMLNDAVIASCKNLPVTTSVISGGTTTISGKATCSTYKLPQGTDTFTAVYHDVTGASGYQTSYTNGYATGTITRKITHPLPPQTNAAPWSAVTYQVVYFGTVSNVTANPSTPVTGQPTLLTDTVVPSFGASTLPTDAAPIVFTVNGSPVTCSAHGGTTTTGHLSATNPPVARCYVAAGLPGGADVVQATYPTDGVYAPSVGSLSMTVAKDVTKTTMTVTTATGSFASGATSGQTLKFTATVAAQSPGSGTPTGTVSFITPALLGQTLCTATLVGGKATCYDTNVPVPAGSPNPVLFQATYAGDTGFGSSVSTVPARTAATLGTNALAIYKETATVKSFTVLPTTPVYGQAMTFVVTLDPEIPSTHATGPVTISAPITGVTTPLCVMVLSDGSDNIGSCTFTPNSALHDYIAAGSVKLTATYTGDDYFQGPAIGNQSTYVAKSKSTTAVIVNPQNPVYGQLPTFTVTVTPNTAGTVPTGKVKITGPGPTGATTTLCTVTLSGGTGSCTSAVVTGGQKNAVFTAAYAGDANFLAANKTGNASSGTVTANIQQAATTTAVTVTSTKAFGATETFHVTVTPTSVPSPVETGPSPAGQVVITAPGVAQTLCTVTNLTATASTIGASKGTCTLTSSVRVPVGTNVRYTATYAGNTNFAGSTGSTANTITKATPTATLTLSAATITYGSESSETFTVQATSSAGTPTGTVTVKRGSTTICTVNLVTGSGTCSPGATAIASTATHYTVTAVYNGDASFATATSSAKSLTVNKASSSTSVVMSPASALYGSETAATATVAISSPDAPTGTIAVKSGSTTLCSVSSWTNGVGSCTVTSGTALAVGTYTNITATYPGDSNVAASTGTTSFKVTANATAAISVAGSPAAYGSETGVTVTGTASATSGTPSGTGTITNVTTGQVLKTGALAGGKLTVTLTSAQLPAGTYTLVFAYGGSSSYSPATSSTTTLTITKVTPGVGLALSASTVTYGGESSEVFTALVTSPAGTPTGTVAVKRGSTTICTATLVAGSATCSPGNTAIPSTASPYTVTAVYGGDTNFNSATSSAHPLTVAKAPSTTSVVVTPAGVAYGSENTATATVTVSSPDTPGSIAVKSASGGTTLCTVTTWVNGVGTCTVSSGTVVPAGTYPAVTATYAGDANVSGSTGTTNWRVTGPTTVTVSAVAPSAAYGNEHTVTITGTASATSGTPTGTGTITNLTTGAVLGTGALDATGKLAVTLTDGQMPAGTYSVTFAYAGSPTYSPATATPTTVTVTKATTTTMLTAPSTMTYGSESSGVFSVAVAPATSGTPTGTVTVKRGSTTLCTVTLSAGAGSCSPAATAVPATTAAYAVTAVYAGDTNFATSMSAAHTVTVGRATSSTSLVLTPSTVAFGAEGATTAAVTVSGPDVPASVAVKSSATTGTTLCTVTNWVGGVGNCTVTGQRAVPAGSYPAVTATYAGDANVVGSAGTASWSVTAAPTTATLSVTPSTTTFGKEHTGVTSVTLTGTVASTTSGTPAGVG